VVIVDAANVMGSRPDGWWHDRAGAAARLCDQLRAAVLAGRLPDQTVVVLEGASRSGAPEGNRDGIRIAHATGSGDDAIVALAHDAVHAGRPVTVVTADRELRGRVREAGGEVAGPGWLLGQL